MPTKTVDLSEPAVNILLGLPIGYPSIITNVEHRISILSALQTSLSTTKIPLATNLAKRAVFKGKSGTPRCLAWRPEGDHLLCGLAGGEVASYSVVSLECDDVKRILVSQILEMMMWIKAASGEIGVVCATTDGLIFGDSGGKLHFASKNFAPQKSIANAVYSIELSPIASSAAVAVKAGLPVMIDLYQGSIIVVLKGLGFETSCMNWHPRRNLIAAGSKTNQVHLWDPREVSPNVGEDDSIANDLPAHHAGVIANSFTHRGPVTDIKWHPFNDFLMLSCGKDQLIFLWDIRRPTGSGAWVPIEVYRPGNSSRCGNDCSMNTELKPLVPTCIDWHPWDGSLFAVGDQAGYVSFWRDGEMLCRVPHSGNKWSGQSVAVEQLTWHPKRSVLATLGGPCGGINGTITFW